MATDNRTYRTKVYLTCSNSQKNYNFSFDYINSKYVKATLNNTQVLQWGTDYTVKGHTLTLVNNPPQGALLLIYRNTPADRTVAWYDSSILRARDMNLFNTQMLHINEENQDELLDSGIQEDKLDNRWDARWKNIKNLKEPSQDNHAVNLGYLKKTQESYLNASQAKVNEATAQANNSKKSADDAKRYAEQAKGSAEQASVSEATATAKATEASVSATTAVTKATEASTSATTATTKAREASISANTAGSHKDTTKEYMDKTLAYKLEAEASAQLAEDHKMDSGTYAEMARQYRDETIERSGGNFVTESDFNSHKEDPEAHKGLFEAINEKVDSVTTETSKGIDELTKSITDELNTKASISNLNDLKTLVDTKMSTIGGTFTGNVNIKFTDSDWAGINLHNKSGEYFRVETDKTGTTNMATLSRRASSDTLYKLYVPKENGTLATKENINSLKTQLESKINTIPKTSIDGKSGSTTLHSILHRYPTNTSFTNLSNPQWNSKGIFSCYFSQPSKFENQPTQYGQLINLPPEDSTQGHECAQIWLTQNDGQIFTRGGNKDNPVKNRPFNRFVRDVDVANWRKVINTWRSGNNWWREWSDGWIEQGGIQEIMRGGSQFGSNYKEAITVNLFKPVSTQPTITYSIVATSQELFMSKGSGVPYITLTQHTGRLFTLNTNKMDNEKTPTWLLWEARGWK